MAFMKFLGGRPGAEPEAQAMEAETEAVRQIVARLEALPPDRARLVAGMAYVLSRAANSDLTISEVETTAIENFLVDAGLDRPAAVLVTEMAKLQELTTGGTSDYLVTREFRQVSTPEQKVAVLRGCYLVASADATIGAMEIAALREIASELDIEKADADKVRAEFADRISARFRAPEAAEAPEGPETGS
jgi:uncharacterized tellurite resistance protein B-like protein